MSEWEDAEKWAEELVPPAPRIPGRYPVDTPQDDEPWDPSEMTWDEVGDEVGAAASLCRVKREEYKVNHGISCGVAGGETPGGNADSLENSFPATPNVAKGGGEIRTASIEDRTGGGGEIFEGVTGKPRGGGETPSPDAVIAGRRYWSVRKTMVRSGYSPDYFQRHRHRRLPGRIPEDCLWRDLAGRGRPLYFNEKGIKLWLRLLKEAGRDPVHLRKRVVLRRVWKELGRASPMRDEVADRLIDRWGDDAAAWVRYVVRQHGATARNCGWLDTPQTRDRLEEDFMKWKEKDNG